MTTEAATVGKFGLSKLCAADWPGDQFCEQWIVGYRDRLAGPVAALARQPSGTAAALDALLPSILDNAFNGEL